MKEIILSADSEAILYSVPDVVADELEECCMEFCGNWLWESPHAYQYRKNDNGMAYVCYNEQDFIDYLNKWIFPNEQSTLVRRLGCNIEDLPKEYEEYPQFNF